LYTGSSKDLLVWPDSTSVGNFTVARVDAAVIPIDGSVLVMNVSGPVTLAKPATGTYPMVVSVLPAALGSNAQGNIDVYFPTRPQCGNSNPRDANAVITTPQRCTFQFGQNPTACLITLNCASEAIIITQTNQQLSRFNLSVVSVATTLSAATFPQNIVLTPGQAVGYLVNVPSGSEIVVLVSGNATFPSSSVVFSSGGCASTNFVNVVQPAPAGNGQVDLTLSENGVLSIRAPLNSAINFTITTTSNLLCSSDATLLPSVCPSDILAYPIDTGAYTQATAEVNIANYTEIAVKMGLSSVGSSCYNAIVREACITEVPLCLPTSTILNPVESCTENCLARLSLAACPGGFTSQVCAGLGNCRGIPYSGPAGPAPTSGGTPTPSSGSGVPTSGGGNPTPAGGSGNTTPSGSTHSNSGNSLKFSVLVLIVSALACMIL
jgi:hypothetical protein